MHSEDIREWQERAITRAAESLKKQVKPEGNGHVRMRARDLKRLYQEPVVLCAEEVQEQEVSWLWPKRIPLGKLTLIAGDPGAGKSTLALDLCARVSCARDWPDGENATLPPSSAIILSAEDAPDDTIKPRLLAAGADCSKIHILVMMKEPIIDEESGEVVLGEYDEVPFTIPDHLATLEELISNTQAKIVVIDPVNAYLSGEVNTWRDHDIRRALSPLALIAQRTGAAIVVIAHLNKAAAGQALYRVGGSIGLVGINRMAHIVCDDPDDPDGKRKVFAVMKSNVAAPASSIVFTIEEAANGSSRIVYSGFSRYTAQDLLDLSKKSGEDRTAFDEACEFLRSILADGPLPATEVLRMARESGFTEPTLRRAKYALRVKSRHNGSGRDGQWFWVLAPCNESDDEKEEEEREERTQRDETRADSGIEKKASAKHVAVKCMYCLRERIDVECDVYLSDQPGWATYRCLRCNRIGFVRV